MSKYGRRWTDLLNGRKKTPDSRKRLSVLYMKIVRGYADKRGNKRKYIAAVAVATSDNEAADFSPREYALENGFYVIEQTGDTIRIKAPPELAYW